MKEHKEGITMENIGQIVKRLREEKGWNQAELGVYAKVSTSTVSLIEAGKRNPSSRTLQNLADALGVEVSDFFPKEHALTLPLEVDEGRYEDFRRYLQVLPLEDLRRLGAEINAELNKAVLADETEKAADLYSRSVLVGRRIEELDPPLATVRLMRGAPAEVTFYREPTEAELAELEEKYPGFVVAASPVNTQ